MSPPNLLRNDEDAVSPVIGVILMIAITVVLAAVIATFVLGMESRAGTVQPTASFDFDYDPDNETLTIRHDGGEAIRYDELYLRGDGLAGGASEHQWDEANASSTTDGTSAVVSGDRRAFPLDSATHESYDVSLVWQEAGGDASARLATDTGPDA